MTGKIFISYSTTDKFFAELLAAKLAAADIPVWRDISSLKAGEEWRQSIDLGIANSKLMIVALSSASCASHYVTYEWATALAQGKSIVPVLLEKCSRHPKLEPLQYIDFTTHSEATWQRVVQRVRELWNDQETYSPSENDETSLAHDALTAEEEFLAAKIIGYMNEHGFRMITFRRIQNIFGEALSEKYLAGLARRHPRFRMASLADKRPGLAVL